VQADADGDGATGASRLLSGWVPGAGKGVRMRPAHRVQRTRQRAFPHETRKRLDFEVEPKFSFCLGLRAFLRGGGCGNPGDCPFWLSGYLLR
jgi:hypothetical protein